jgi:formylglycine-generating enzyme required for sulfatase activity
MKSTISSLFLFSLGLAAPLPGVILETVTVGNAGNPSDGPGGFGSVGYEYQIGKYEVTVGQYVEFLNAVGADDTFELYNFPGSSSPYYVVNRFGSSGSYTYASDAPSVDNLPMTFVSMGDAMRFANWMTNGQPTGAQGVGSTETGVYDLSGLTGTNRYNVPISVGLNRDATAWAAGGYAIANLDEWYKAAYYDGNGGYTNFATQSNDVPTGEAAPGGVNSANLFGAYTGMIPVGSYSSAESHYGTFDQTGNALELLSSVNPDNSSAWATMGGSFTTSIATSGFASKTGWSTETTTSNGTLNLGFRLVTLGTSPVPEPSTYALWAAGLIAGFAVWRRRRASRAGTV